VSSGPSLVDGLLVDRPSPVRRLPPVTKLVATLAFVVAVVATPREAVWAYLAYAVIVGGAVAAARLPPHRFVRRLAVELPFVAFALLLPMLGGGERTEVLGLSLSVAGLWGAWAILAKGTLGVAASVVLVSTTPAADLVEALHRLPVPKTITLIGGFMVRYLDVVAGDLHRMQVARVSRGDDPRWLGQVRALAATAGTVFVRTYERGERVQQAMVARGFDGTLPRPPDDPPPSADAWLRALALPAVAVVVLAAAWIGP